MTRCDGIQESLTAASLGAAPLATGDQSHLDICEGCREHAEWLVRVARELTDGEPGPPSLAVERSRRAAVQALRARRLPHGFVRDVAVGLSIALLALPLVLGEAFLVGRFAARVLAPVLPELVLGWLGLTYFGSVALALGVAYGSIPLAVALARSRAPLGLASARARAPAGERA